MLKNPPTNAGHVRSWFDAWIGNISWSKKWQPAPVFLPGKFHGQRSLAGYNPWSHKESDTNGDARMQGGWGGTQIRT